MPRMHQAHPVAKDRQVERVEATIIPTVEATIIDGHADIISIFVSNESGATNAKFTIKDKQGTPRVFVFGADTKVPAEGVVGFGPGPGERATGGLTWVQDTADALSCRINYRRP